MQDLYLNFTFLNFMVISIMKSWSDIHLFLSCAKLNFIKYFTSIITQMVS